jgi:heterodisulfide reductase subunit C
MELETIKLKDCDPNFAKEVIEAGGKKANVCFQCGTCTAGCPTVYAMDYTPRQIMRMVNLGMRDEVLKSGTIWVCASCFTCQSRCPRGVEITSVMGALKSIAIKERITPENKKGPAFYNSFLDVTMKHGRVYEAELMLRFAVRSESSLPGAVKSLSNDIPLGMGLVKKGKMAFLPHSFRRPEQLKIIYDNIRKMEDEK